ncbi:MAG TPA: SGNH/GDSL hydrolase family protein [Kiritimatiellia bacterium]|nr:SGNH/GDSL hydrolase family protein [Kiritimatiellia bacterium]HMP33705.1 SGNH/GDSL hydrolase family protein [Kiritimatiellia bacterium]
MNPEASFTPPLVVRLTDLAHRRWGGFPARILRAGLLFAALACFFLAAAVIVRGEPWAFIIYAEDPYAHAAGGFLFLAAWHWFGRGYREGWPAWRARLGKAMLALFGFAFSFAAAEVCLRMVMHARQQGNSLQTLNNLDRQQPKDIRTTHPLGLIVEPSPYPSIVYQLRPDLDLPFGNRALRTNRIGLRDSVDYPVGRLPHSVRIVGLGDSGMFGWDVDQDGDYLAVMERTLQARQDGVTYEAMNFAVPGYNSQLEVETLKHRALAYDPDIVVVGWCENDGQLPFFLLEKEDFARRDVSFLNMLLTRRDDFRQIASGTRIKDLRTMDRSNVSADILSGTEAEGLRRVFTELKTLSDQHGFHVLVFGPLGDGIHRLITEIGLPTYNTRQRIKIDDYPLEWAIHFMHPRPEGHQVLGERLAAELHDRGWLIPRP